MPIGPVSTLVGTPPAPAARSRRRSRRSASRRAWRCPRTGGSRGCLPAPRSARARSPRRRRSRRSRTRCCRSAEAESRPEEWNDARTVRRFEKCTVMHVPAATCSTSGSGASVFFSTRVAMLVGTKAARSWLPNALFGTSTALMSNERCGARAGHGIARIGRLRRPSAGRGGQRERRGSARRDPAAAAGSACGPAGRG